MANPLVVTEGVYSPQQDSQLLVDVMEKVGLAQGNRVADLCTGSGFVAVGAAEQGASAVTAFDICPRAVRCARANAAAAGADVAVHLGPWTRAAEFAPFELVVSNPPYVPRGPCDDTDMVPAAAGPAQAWNAGADGRLVLDPLCAAVPGLLVGGGTFLLVQSEFSGIPRSLAALSDAGMNAEVLACQWIPFGPVLSARARWLERTGRLEPGRREEELVVIRADAP